MQSARLAKFDSHTHVCEFCDTVNPVPSVKTIRPSNLSRTLALVPPTVVLVSQYASGAFSGFLKFDTVIGESIDAKRANWIDITSISFGVSNALPPSGTGSSVGKAADFIITKKLDRSSPQLFLNSLTGAAVPTVILEFTGASTSSTNPVFYRITLENVVVKKIDSTGIPAGTDTRPNESVSLGFEKIKLEYYYQDSKGGMTAVPAVTWNFTTNAP